MKIKNYLACLAAAMLCGAMTACVSTNDSAAETEEGTEIETVTEEETEIETVAFEEMFDANPGQAYLAIVDGQYWIQYWGSSTDEGSMLSYDAGIADITGNGTYTVSVNADTNGFRYDTTSDPNGEYTPSGLNFLAVMIPEGETMYPGIILTVDSIKVDGQEIELKAKNYTSSDDSIETRTNLYNAYIDAPSSDARSVEGALFDDDGNALDICSAYSPQIFSPAAFASWTKVEVTFTVSGIDETDPADANAEASIAADNGEEAAD